MKKSFCVILVIVMILAFVAACGPAEEVPGAVAPATGAPVQQPAAENVQAQDAEDESGYRHGGTLRIVEAASAGGPLGLTWVIRPSDTWLIAPAMQNLVREFHDGSVEPQLAESWSVDEDNDVVRFYLRQGVVFHDGSQFNAEVVVFNLDLIQENIALIPFEATVIDDYTVDVHFPNGLTNGSVGFFAHVNFRIMSMESYLQNGEDWALENPVGTGPFRLVEYIPGLHVILERFDDYWEPGKPYLDSIEFHMIGDVMTQNLALAADPGQGAVDALRTQTPEQGARFREMGYHVHSVTNRVKSLFPSSDNPDSPFVNKYVRLALSAAIDRELIMTARGFGIQYPMYQFIVSSRPSHVTDSGYGVPRYDPDLARELLARGGFPDGFRTTMTCQPGSADREAFVAIQNMLENVGIIVDIEFPEGAGFVSTRSNGWEGILTNTVTNFVHIENNFTQIFGQDANQFFSMQNSDELEALGQATQFFGDNRAAIREAQDYMLDNGLVIPLWASPELTIMRPGVHGWTDLAPFNWADMWVEWD